MDCIFCKILDGELPAKIIYSDDLVIAFDDIYPKAPQHKLIIPRKHINTLNDVAPEDYPLLSHMLVVAKQLASDLGIAESGYRVMFNCNRDGGQEVYHLHLHLIGGWRLHWPPK